MLMLNSETITITADDIYRALVNLIRRKYETASCNTLTDGHEAEAKKGNEDEPTSR
jgi:hypothetical protein